MDAPPPPYEEATGGSSSSNPSRNDSHLRVRNGIPPHVRRSMEDEGRPLPKGWIRQYDAKNHHQFFVNTNVEPPHSIWHHPYDDEDYLDSLDSSERKRVMAMHRVPTEADLAAESSDEDGEGGHHHNRYGDDGSGGDSGYLPPRDTNQPTGMSKFGRKMKDKMTSSTHEQREAERRQRAEEERKQYERYQVYRLAMSKAVETGQPQFIGKGRDGKDVFIEPPNGPNLPQGARGYNPYTQGPYANPNATFIRPQYAYSRPYGYGYGGGYGLPLAGGMAGGLMGGMLLGDMMGGGMGMGGGFF
ncbi:MAG: hypothetical protein M1827_007439 [Pycnora praestabilis]|nr:MAG: hypothetical protein M1827_007439 [Pycnora praestabilis]